MKIKYKFKTIDDKTYIADVTSLDNILSFIRLSNVQEQLKDGSYIEIGPIMWLNKNNVISVKPV
jgi:hypothetical protein